jgi:hypothetical protein
MADTRGTVAARQAPAGSRARRILGIVREYWFALLLILLAAATFVFGIWGFWEVDNEFKLPRLTDTAAFFVMEPPPERPDDRNWQLELARVLALVALVFATWKTFYILFKDRYDAFRARTSHGHVVVCGLGRRGSRLVRAFKEAGYRVIAIEDDARESATRTARARGARVVLGAATDEAVLERASVARARCVVAVGPNDSTNLEIATKVLRIARDRPEAGPRVVVQIRDEGLADTLSAKALSSSGAVRLEFVNIATRAAWSLLDTPGPLESESEDTPHLLVAGFGPMGEELVLAASMLWRRLSGDLKRPLQITVVDAAASRRLARLLRRSPQVADWCELAAIDDEPEIAVLDVPGLLAEDGSPTRAYVCLDDSIEALSTGLELLRRTGEAEIPVVVSVLSEEESAGRFLTAGGSFEVGLHLSGLIEQTCTAELLLETPVETVARLQQRDYVRQMLAAGKRLGQTPFLRPWEEMTDVQREENREWARSVPAKLETVGADLRPIADWDLALFKFSPDELERLGKLEHERWRAWRARNGWRYGETRDDVAKTHPDMVPWEQLGEASREIDRDQVDNLPRQLARAGYEIYRPAPDGAAAEAAEAAIARSSA